MSSYSSFQSLTGPTGPSGPGGAGTLNVIFSNGAVAILPGTKLDVVVDVACIIREVIMVADQSGSIVIDIWKDTYANYPPTVADSIVAAAKPTIAATTKARDATLTGWTTAIAAGDSLRFNVDSCSGITRLSLALKLERV